MVVDSCATFGFSCAPRGNFTENGLQANSSRHRRDYQKQRVPAVRQDSERDSAGGGGRRGEGGRGRGENFAARALQPYANLNLTEDQQAQVTEALRGVRQELAALRQQGATPEQLQARVAELGRSAVVAVLTPEQTQRREAAGDVAMEAPRPGARAAGAERR